MSSLNPGIVSTADITRPNATYLPLESLTAHVCIADVFARVELSQLYSNTKQDALVDAHYVFPVPARGAVCSFDMRTDDGRRLKGVVKEIAKAKADYEEAVSQGRLAGLLQQFRQDGTIPARTSVTISLSYVMDLSEAYAHDAVRFQLPFHVGARYGAPPTSALYHGTAHTARLSITVEVEMASRIINVISPSHLVEHISQGSSQSAHSGSDNYACVQWVSTETFLDRDFLLEVQASDLDRPRCLAETLSSSNGLPGVLNGAPTTALALSVVPRFKLPTLSMQEYIFLIDRSGSMSGQKMETAKDALGILARMLPSSNTFFNIFSFGSCCNALWHQSQCYDRATLDTATWHINGMQADMGGTELFGALNCVFSSWSRTSPTSVFVLTDGEVDDPKGTIIDYVRRMVSSAPVAAPLRLFTLGIGNGASTHLCEGIARAGNGFCSMALDVEDIMERSSRLVDAMRVSTVKDLKVDWGVPDQALQAPYPVPTISPGVRTVITAIVSHNAPKQVTLSGRLSDGNQLEYSVPVRVLSPRFASIRLEASRKVLNIPPLIHTIAAHRYIKGLDAGELQPHDLRFGGLSPPTRRELVKNLIVELGTQYQVASSCTAFVAVDVPIPPTPRVGSPKRDSPRASSRRPTRDNSVDDTDGIVTSDPPQNISSPHTDHGNDDAATDGKRRQTSPEQASGKNSTVLPGQAHDTEKNSAAPPGQASATGKSRQTPPGHASGKISTGLPAQASDTGKNSTAPPGHASTTGKNSTASPPKRRGSPGIDRRPEFYAYDPPVATQAGEVLVLPDPLGGKPIICTAPPLPHTSIFSRFTGRSFLSFLFRPAEATRGGLATLGVSVWQAVRNVTGYSRTGGLSSVSHLQEFDGSFTLNQQLFSAVGISEDRIRSSIPLDLASTDGHEQVWATAIAVAFFRSKYPRQAELWETLQDKASEFGSKSLAGGSVVFEKMVEEALKLFLP